MSKKNHASKSDKKILKDHKKAINVMRKEIAMYYPMDMIIYSHDLWTSCHAGKKTPFKSKEGFDIYVGDEVITDKSPFVGVVFEDRNGFYVLFGGKTEGKRYITEETEPDSKSFVNVSNINIGKFWNNNLHGDIIGKRPGTPHGCIAHLSLRKEKRDFEEIFNIPKEPKEREK